MKKYIICCTLLLPILLVSCSFEKQKNWTSEISKQIPEENTDSLWFSDTKLIEKNTKKNITLDATKWEYNLKELYVTSNDEVTLNVNNIDTLHWIAIPDLRLVWKESIEFQIDTPWKYIYRCAYYCGDGHEDMTWVITVE